MFFLKKSGILGFYFWISVGCLFANKLGEQCENYFYPIVEKQLNDIQTVRFLRPFGAQYKPVGKDEPTESYFLYPFGRDYRKKEHIYWSNFFGLFNYDWCFSAEKQCREGQFLPFYFFKRGYGVESDYAAVWPLGGTVKNFLGKDRSDWFLWPLWVKTCKGEQVNYWAPWPFITVRKGDSQGFALWPLGGHFYKKNEYDERYMVWPLFYRHQYWQSEESLKTGFLPLYTYEKTAKVKDLSIIWPIWGHRWEKHPHYEEHRILWPLWVQGRGDTRLINRWAPFHTYSENKVHKTNKEWFLWPFIKQQNWIEQSVAVHQEQFLYFLFWHQEQKNAQTGEFLGNKTHFWPFYSYWNNGKGHEQVQVLSPFEVFFPDNKMIREIYTPLFSLYRYEKDGSTIRQSFLFKLFYEKQDPLGQHLKYSIFLEYKNRPQEKYFSLLKGLLEYKKIKEEKSFRVFWITLKKKDRQRKDLKTL